MTAERVPDFGFATQAFKQNPFPTLSRLVAAGPFIRTRFPMFGNVWMATSYEAVSELLRRHELFLINPAAAGNRWMKAILHWLPRSLKPIATNMLLRDEPDHRRLRRLVERAFQIRTVEAMRPRLEALADEALDRLAQRAAAAPRGVDLLAEFCRPYPLSVICELLGLPVEDRPKFTRWAFRFSTANTLWGIAGGMYGLSRLMSYSRGEIERQRRKPAGGLLTALIEAEEAGDRLTADELLAMAFLLLAAGHETTLHQIGCSVLALLDNPPALEVWKTRPENAAAMVDELFRHVSFAQVAKPRYAREDTEFRGQQIQRGEAIFACLASANADPSCFPRPEQLDFSRDAQRHLAFGSSIHFCLGAALARMETDLALRGLFGRFPAVRLAVPRTQVRYSLRPGTRGLVSLPVHL